MPADKIAANVIGIDLSGRFFVTTAVVASPAAAGETIIASLTVSANAALTSGVWLAGWAAYTVGTNGTAVQLRLRQTNVAGTVVGNTGALTGSQHGAAILSADDVNGFDAAAVLPGQTYVLTMQVTAGSAVSTVSGVFLSATVI